MANPEWDNYKPQQYAYVLCFYDPIADRGEAHGIIAAYTNPIDADKEKLRLEKEELDTPNEWARRNFNVAKIKYFD